MGKISSSKSSRQITQKHLHSRVSYLYQAAAYLASVDLHSAGQGESNVERVPVAESVPAQANFVAQSSYMLNQMRAVSLKSQVRLSREIKHSVCKRCSRLLIPGRTSTERIENLSNGSQKPWADVLVICCKVCGTCKRFPVGSKRIRRKSTRSQSDEAKAPNGNAFRKGMSKEEA